MRIVPAAARCRLGGLLWSALVLVAAVSLTGLAGAPAQAQTLPAVEIVERLRAGGLVVFFRHGQTGPGGADRHRAVIGDCQTQRNLNDVGRAQVRQLGEDFRALGVRASTVLASDFCRAWQHAEAMFGAGGYKITADLTVPESYPGVSAADRELNNANLRALLAARPAAGTNTVLVSHGINVLLLTGYHPDVMGEAVIFQPDGLGGFTRIGSILPDKWTEVRRARGL